MFCKKCGTEIPKGAKFCEKCGASVGSELQGHKEGVSHKKWILGGIIGGMAVVAVVVVSLFATGVLDNNSEMQSNTETMSESVTQPEKSVVASTMAPNPTLEPAENSVENVGEATMVSHTVTKNYFEKATLSREQTRAKNKDMLTQFANNENVTDAQKEKAMNEIMKMTDVSEKEIATESLLATKGVNETFVIILDDSVDVVVNSQKLTEQQFAQIKDMVKHKLECEADQIVISSVSPEIDNSDDALSEENENETNLKSITVTKNHFKETKQDTLIQLVNNKNPTDTQREEAINEIIKMIEINEKETAVENLLPANGFHESVVTILDDNVNVVVNVQELPEQQIARIADIVKSKTKYPADKILISTLDK